MSWWNTVTDWFGGGDSGGGGTDWWGALMGGLSAYSDAKQSSKSTKDQGKWALKAVQEQGKEARKNAEFGAGLADYYKELDKERRRKGFSNFGQFSSRQYNQPYTPPPVGPAPTAVGFESGYDPNTGQPIQRPTTGGGLAGFASGG